MRFPRPHQRPEQRCGHHLPGYSLLPSVCCTRCTDNGEGKVRYRHQVCFNNLEDFEEYLTQGEYAVGEYRRAPGLPWAP